MSAQGDASFMRRFREELTETIEAEKTRLVSLTTERRAGVIQGLMIASEMADNVYREMSGEDRSPPNRQPGTQQ